MDFIRVDNQTLILTTILILLMMIVILLIMQRQHWEIKGLGYAIFGDICMVLSNIFVYINSLHISNKLTIFVSVFDLLGMTFLIVAIFIFFDEKVKRNKYIILNILNLLITYYFFYISPEAGFRRASFPLILLLLCLDGAILMRKKHKTNKLISYRVIKYTLYFFIIFNTYRIIFRLSNYLNLNITSVNNNALSNALLGLLFFFILITFSFILMTLDTLYNNVKQLSFKDPLTGLFNRRYLEEYLDNHMKELKRNNKNFLIAIVDIDNFKKINDIYGHNIGDKLLIWFANLLKVNLREMDVIARYGGDEFLIIINNTDLENGYIILDRVLNMARRKNWRQKKLNLTFSGSIMDVDYKHLHLSVFEIIDEIDRKMYVAKKEGRNKILIIKSDVVSFE